MNETVDDILDDALAYVHESRADFVRDELNRLRSIEQPVPAVPDGWKLVPVEATPEMVEAAAKAKWGPGMHACIEAAIAAAPTPESNK